MATPGINDATQELGYAAKRSVMYASGKHSAMALGIEAGHEGMFSATGAAGAVAVGTTLGLASVLSAALTQMDYRHKIKQIKNFYADEIAARSGGDAKKLNDAHLSKVADGNAALGVEGNKTLAEAVSNTRRQRNFNFAFSVLSTMASVGAVLVAAPAIPAMAGLGALAGTAHVLITAVVGVLAYNAVKRPLHALGDKLFDLDRETTHDRIVDISRDRAAGKHISREQVLDVFVSANRPLAEFIASEYGEEYGKLPVRVKQKAAEDLSKLLPLDAVTQNLNAGEMNVSELAFTAQGQFSGVVHPHHEEARKPGMLTGALGRLKEVVTHHAHNAPAPAPAAPPVTKRTVVEYDNEAPAVSFVSRLGRTPHSRAPQPHGELASMRFVERLEQPVRAAEGPNV